MNAIEDLIQFYQSSNPRKASFTDYQITRKDIKNNITEMKNENISYNSIFNCKKKVLFGLSLKSYKLRL